MYDHKYILPNEGEMCRESFVFAYGFTGYDFDKCSMLKKASADGRIVYQKHQKPWSESHIPEFTHVEIL